MSRPARIQYENAYYHVMSRGSGRRRMFLSSVYYETFLTTLAQATERFNVQVHAYCLMPNHYHLLVKTPDANLDRAMRHINGVYTQRHNKLKRTDGSLMRGRYKAILVERESYYLTLTRYIHRNPIDAKRPLVKDLQQYLWSSYRAYAGLASAPPWLHTDEVFTMFTGINKPGLYQIYVDQGNDQHINQVYAKKRLAPVLGNGAFKQWVQATYLEARSQHTEHARDTTQITRPTMRQIIDAVAEYFQLEPSRVTQGQLGYQNVPRWMAMYLSQQLGGYKLAHIAAEFGVTHYSSVATLIMKLRTLMATDKQVSKDIAILKQTINSLSKI